MRSICETLLKRTCQRKQTIAASNNTNNNWISIGVSSLDDVYIPTWLHWFWHACNARTDLLLHANGHATDLCCAITCCRGVTSKGGWCRPSTCMRVTLLSEGAWLPVNASLLMDHKTTDPAGQLLPHGLHGPSICTLIVFHSIFEKKKCHFCNS